MSFNNSQYCYNSSNQAKLPITPGAYAFYTLYDEIPGMFPIYGNISSFGQFGINDNIDKYLVLPGYSLYGYQNANYDGAISTYDNTAGITVFFGFFGSVNDSSCKLFYNGTIDDNDKNLGTMTYTGAAGSEIGVQVGNFNKFPYTINASNNIVEALFPGAYFFNLNHTGGENFQVKVFPIYGCIKNYNDYEIGTLGVPTVNPTYLVLPEFQLLTYNNYNWTEPPQSPDNQIGPYVNYSGTSYMYGLIGAIDNDNSCTLGFKSNDSPNNTVLGLMNRIENSQSSTGWSGWSGLPDNYPGSFKNGPIFYTTPAGTPFPPTPFAWAFVRDSDPTIKALPIYGSIPDYTYYTNFNDTVDSYLVLPGFCLITFNAINWIEGVTYYDNREGNDYLYKDAGGSNNDTSCLLFYKGLSNTTNLLGLQSIVV
jgi:hypothetical protein